MLIAATVEFVVARTWGGMLIVDESGGYSFSCHAVLGMVAAIFYSLSPAFGSYIALKKNGKVSSLKEWFKNIFYVRSSIFHYALVGIGLTLYFFIHISISGLSEMMPLYWLLGLIPLAVVAGGMEEAGWSHILQPELDKKYGYFVSSAITGLFWAAWHIPLFFIPGTSQYLVMNMWMAIISWIVMRFFYGAILKISGKAGTFLTLLFHTLHNALLTTFIIYPSTWIATIVALTTIFFISILIVLIYNKKSSQNMCNNGF